MIKEDYTSAEVAELLKEKGMDKSCFKHYVQKNNNDGTSEAVTVCTLQMAMKWLREKHDVFIRINMIQDGMYNAINDFVYKEPIFQYEIIGINGNDTYNLLGEFNSYEEACEDCIKYCLENLI